MGVLEVSPFPWSDDNPWSDDSPSDDGLELGICRIASNGDGLDFAGARFSLWHGTNGDSYFSGVLIRISDDGEEYKIATYTS